MRDSEDSVRTIWPSLPFNHSAFFIVPASFIVIDVVKKTLLLIKMCFQLLHFLVNAKLHTSSFWRKHKEVFGVYFLQAILAFRQSASDRN